MWLFFNEYSKQMKFECEYHGSCNKKHPPGYAMQSQHLVVIFESAVFHEKMTCATQTIYDMDRMHHVTTLSARDIPQVLCL